jgi:hypothetical protein
VPTGKELESLTEEIFRLLTENSSSTGQVSVERDVMLDGADGPRQIDVAMRSVMGPIEILAIIECKDYKRTVTVTAVDALHSVAQDVKANKAILVSRGGFSRKALRKAQRLGIGIYRANQLANVRDAAFEIPVYIREVRQRSVHMSVRLFLEQGTTLTGDSFLNLNDVSVVTLLRDDLLNDPSLSEAPPGRHVWSKATLPPPWFMRDETGRKWEVDELEVSYKLSESHYFGYMTDLPMALYLRNELTEQSTVLLKPEDLIINYTDAFSKFDSADDLPATPVIVGSVAALPDPTDISNQTLTGQMDEVTG